MKKKPQTLQTTSVSETAGNRDLQCYNCRYAFFSNTCFETDTFCSPGSEQTGNQFLPFPSAAAAMKQLHSASSPCKELTAAQWRQQQLHAGCLSRRLDAACVRDYITLLMSELWFCVCLKKTPPFERRSRHRAEVAPGSASSRRGRSACCG